MKVAKLLVIVLSFLCLILIIVLKEERLISNFIKERSTCHSQSCYYLAGRLLENLDTKADPCDDFYQYACGGYIDKKPVNGSLEAEKQDEDEDDSSMYGKIVTLLTRDDNSTELAFMKDVRNYYKTCTNTG